MATLIEPTSVGEFFFPISSPVEGPDFFCVSGPLHPVYYNPVEELTTKTTPHGSGDSRKKFFESRNGGSYIINCNFLLLTVQIIVVICTHMIV